MKVKVAPIGKGFAMALALACGSVAIAQDADNGPPPPPEAEAEAEAEAPAQGIVVVAPRPVKDLPKEDGTDSDVLISLRMTVLYSDLDLASEDDRDRLMTRIRASARDACRYLDRLYPLDPDPGCEDRAVHDAQPQIDAAVASFAPETADDAEAGDEAD